MSTQTGPDGLHWRVRIALPSIALHFVSATQPYIENGQVVMDPLEGYGDEVGFIDRTSVQAATWRMVIPEGYVPPEHRVSFNPYGL
jgi:hypothetical protein